jgi:hypothetical protein
MELGQHQLQLLVSIVLILGAAFVALICDFLKGNNEQLRELTLELKVRREEERKRARLLTPSLPQAAEASVAQPAAAAAAAAPAKEAAVEKPKRAERKRTVNSEALAAMERGAMLASTGGRVRSSAPVETKPEFAPVEVVAQAAPAASSIKKDWSSILSRKAPAAAAPRNADLLSQVVAATNSGQSSGEVILPAGFQDGYVLNNLVKSRQPVSGLVVSIGVNAPRTAEGALPDSVHQLVQSLIGPNDFAAQSANDEFLLIYPEERGASAQRKLSQIAQQLWDFQLRSLGSIQILFSWGGVEVRSESIEDAIASASERMQETKRGRKLLTMPAQAQADEARLRQAV